MNLNDLNNANPIATTLLIIWSYFWHGLALWRAAKHEQKYWFVVMLLFGLPTLGILDITYLFFFCKKRLKLNEIDLKSFFKRTNS